MDEWAADRFEIVPGYLNTATLGLPTRATIDAVRQNLVGWQAGDLHAPSFDREVERCRVAYAQLATTTPSNVAAVGQASVTAELVASNCPDGTTVLCAEGDFTSVIFPFMVNPKTSIRFVPIESLIDSIGEEVDLVAVSAAQSSSGFLLDLDALAEAAERSGTRIFLDVTQAAGWVAFDADRFDVTVSHAYKWLCCPRGAGFMTVNAAGAEWLRPLQAGWYAGGDPWTSIYGTPLRLARDARKYDLSPAWFSFAGAAPALETLAEAGVVAIGAHSVGLANAFRSMVGMEPSNSATVSLTSTAAPSLTAAGVKHSERAGRIRLSFYVYNTMADVEQAAALVRAADNL
jgi:selenocysteine lyase/cysteine desulfurase